MSKGFYSDKRAIDNYSRLMSDKTEVQHWFDQVLDFTIADDEEMFFLVNEHAEKIKKLMGSMYLRGYNIHKSSSIIERFLKNKGNYI